jgi:hypothetical protein
MKRCVAGLAALIALSMGADAHAQAATAAAPAPPATDQSQGADKKAPPPKKPAKPKPKKSPNSAAATDSAAQKKDAAAPVPPIAPQPAPVASTADPVEPNKPTADAVGPSPSALPIDPPGRARLLVPVADTAAQSTDSAEREPVPVVRPTLSAAADPPSQTPASTATSAKDKEEIEVLRQTTLNLIKLLVESGILTQEKAEALMREAKQSAAQSAAAQAGAESKVVRVPYVPQFMRDQIKEEVRQDVIAQAKEERWALPNAVPEWVDRFTFWGYFRLRYQDNILSPNNAQAVDVNGTNLGQGTQLLNTTQSFDYLRYQLNLGVNVKISDQMMVGASLASGNQTNPVSLNQTLGNGFNKNSVVIDLAYLKYDPERWFTAWGGRIPNPFYSTDLVWYDQLNFDGLAATARAPIGSHSRGWLTLGAFPVDTIDCNSAISTHCGDNKWLFGGQGVFETALAERHKLTLSLAYYDWYNYQGQFNSPTVNTLDRSFVPRFAQKGNTYFNVVTAAATPPLLGLAAQYKELDFTGSLDLGYWDPVRAILTADVVKNIGYDQQQILQQTGGLVNQPPRTLGWYLRLLVGAPFVEKWGDWQAWAGYKYVQRDAVVDGYNDPDFHFGGTDAKGYLLGLNVGIAKNAFARVRWYSANAIDGPPFAWDVLQFDVGARF